MKIQVTNYTFDASAKTVTFSDYGTIRLDSILLITNVTDNVIIYNFADPTKGGTVATNVLTLTYDTTSMADTDKLQIFYDDSTYVQEVDTNLDISGLATSANQQTDALTDTELRATPVPVSATDLDIRPLVNTDIVTAELSAVDNAVLDAIEADTSTLSGTVKSETAINTDTAVNIQTKPVDKFKWSFAKVTSGIDTAFGTLIKTGSGMAVNQTAGNLVITTGTTAYSETIIRSLTSFKGAGVVRWGLTLSQRIANNNFVVEWVDVVGDSLTLAINSTTSVTITKVAHGFTASDIGKGIWIGNISVASCLPQRAVIAPANASIVSGLDKLLIKLAT